MRRGGRGRCPSCRRTCQNSTSRSCLRCWAVEPSGRSQKTPATGDDETMMQEAAVDIALQLFTDDGGLQALLASDEPSAERVALEGADNALANSRARLDQLYELVRASEGVSVSIKMRVRLNRTQSKSAGFQAPGGGMTKNGGRIWAHDGENSVVDPLGERTKELADRCASRCHRAERARARRPCSGTRSSGALTRARSPMRRG